MLFIANILKTLGIYVPVKNIALNSLMNEQEDILFKNCFYLSASTFSQFMKNLKKPMTHEHF